MWVFHGGRNHPGVEVDAHGRKPFDNAMGPINKQLVFKTKSGTSRAKPTMTSLMSHFTPRRWIVLLEAT